jgi:hypothetical protein
MCDTEPIPVPNMGTNDDSIAQLMMRFRKGDSVAAAQLVEALYPQLKRIAASRMRSERSDHSLQPTALVNELYLELIKIRSLRDADSDTVGEKAAFLRLSAHLMRRLLIHHARPLSKRVDFETQLCAGWSSYESSKG